MKKQDFLDEVISQRTRKNPQFPNLVAKAGRDFVERRCHECGTGTVKLVAKPGRVEGYKGILLIIPENVQIPTCDYCEAEWVDIVTAKKIDAALEPLYKERKRWLRNLKVGDEVCIHEYSQMDPFIHQFHFGKKASMKDHWPGTCDVRPWAPPWARSVQRACQSCNMDNGSVEKLTKSNQRIVSLPALDFRRSDGRNADSLFSGAFIEPVTDEIRRKDFRARVVIRLNQLSRDDEWDKLSDTDLRSIARILDHGSPCIQI